MDSETTQRKPFVGGNWKSNNTVNQTGELVTLLNGIQIDTSKVEVVVAPVFLHIPFVKTNINKEIQVSAQNVNIKGMGAFTGEISAEHVKDFGLEWVILGHSERRSYNGETNELVAEKVKRCLDLGLKVIACIGEQLSEREANQTFNVVQTQLDAIVAQLKPEQWSNVVVAYEPVWAIGTGQTATSAEAQEVHAFIREYLTKNVSPAVSNSTRVLYGGSVTGKNSTELISQKDIDGFLVGGASLKPEFKDIIDSCQTAKK